MGPPACHSAKPKSPPEEPSPPKPQTNIGRSAGSGPGSGGSAGMVTGDDQMPPVGCSPRRRNTALARDTISPFCTSRGIHQPDAPALALHRCAHLQRGDGGRPEQIDREPCRLQPVAAAGLLDGAGQNAADDVAAERRTPRPLRHRVGQQHVTIGYEVGRRSGSGLVGFRHEVSR